MDSSKDKDTKINIENAPEQVKEEPEERSLRNNTTKNKGVKKPSGFGGFTAALADN